MVLLVFLSGSYFYGYDNEIPLGDIKGFVADKDKNIYVGCGFYERVQVYNENDKILIRTARGDEQILFDLNGTVLSKKGINHQTYTNSETDWKTFITSQGEKHEIKGSLFQKIVKLNPEKTIINQSILLQLIKGPFNVWLLAVIGGVIGFFAKNKNAENYKFWKKFKKTSNKTA